MQIIGFQHNYAQDDSKRRRITPSFLNRVALIDHHLREQGHQLFVYSPGAVRSDSASVPGLLFENGTFVRETRDVPHVNGNWTHRTRRLIDKGMGYAVFERWASEHGIGVYVPHSFSELMGNKLETYKLVRGFHETLHPHCESLSGTARQLEYFLDTGRTTFVKPRTGSKGNRILTLRRDGDGVSITRYHKGGRQRSRARSTAEVVEIVREATRGKRRYVIQHGVETLRHDGATFDLRVTMLHDGRSWHYLHEARLSRAGSDVSNVSQGGGVQVAEDVLFEVLGPETSRDLLHELRSESFGLATYLEQLHPGDILEVAFDFAVDTEGRLRLLEVNTKPGLAGIGADVSVFDKGPEHEAGFQRWVFPHTRHLAEFLLRKARART